MIKRSQYKSLAEWRKKDPFFHRLATARGQLTIIAKTLGWELPGNRKISYKNFTKNQCSKEAKKFYLLRDWREKSPQSYNVAVKNKWAKELSKHMWRLHISEERERFVNNALKHTRFVDWIRKKPHEYKAAISYNKSFILKEIKSRFSRQESTALKYAKVFRLKNSY